MVTLKPLAIRSFAREEEMIPFPSEEATPPVVKIYRVSAIVMIGSNKVPLLLLTKSFKIQV